MVVYFSGTGNSRYCAQIIAEETADSLFNANDAIRDRNLPTLSSAKPWVFVSPTYAWQIPRVFERFLQSCSFSGSKDAYFVMTCGSDIGNASQKLSRLCEKIGLHYNGVLPVIMPENYIAMFPVPDAEESKGILAAAVPVLQQGIRKILRGEAFPPHSVSLADRLKTGPVNAVFYKFCISAKQFYTTESCISCGKCEKACPLNNISLVNGRPRWGKHCTHCMACICGCPTEAVEYGKISKNKPRYQCEEYRNSEF